MIQDSVCTARVELCTLNCPEATVWHINALGYRVNSVFWRATAQVVHGFHTDTFCQTQKLPRVITFFMAQSISRGRVRGGKGAWHSGLPDFTLGLGTEGNRNWEEHLSFSESGNKAMPFTKAMLLTSNSKEKGSGPTIQGMGYQIQQICQQKDFPWIQPKRSTHHMHPL